MESLQTIDKLFNKKESCVFEIEKCELLYNPEDMRKVLRITLGKQSDRYSNIKISVCCYNSDGLKLAVMDKVPYVKGGMLLELPSLLTEAAEVAVAEAELDDGIVWSEDAEFPNELRTAANEAFESKAEAEESDDTVVLDSSEVEREIEKSFDAEKNKRKLEKIKKYEEEEELRQIIKNDPSERKKRFWTRIAIFVTMIVVVGGGMYAVKYKGDADAAYNKAMNLYNGGKFEDAAAELEKTDAYMYMGEKKVKLNWAIAMTSARNYDFHKAALYFKKCGDYSESSANYRSILNSYDGIVSAGKEHTVFLKSDGSVIAVGGNEKGQCNTEKWTDISKVSAGGNHTAAIDKGRKAYAVGDAGKGQCDVSGWADIIDISAGENHTVGVENIGRVVATGDNTYGQCDVDDWSGIISVGSGGLHTVGLKLDGTVVATGDNTYGQCDVGEWKDIIFVDAGEKYTVGLTKDGKIVFAGFGANGAENAKSEKNVFSVSAGYNHIIVVYEDGTTSVFGENDRNQNITDLWRNIAVAAGGENHSVGVTTDGKAYAVGANEKGQASVSELNGIGIPKMTVTIRKGS